MNQPSVRSEDVEPVPVAVIRRQVTRAELPRLVPEFCGQVWAELRRQNIRGGHNVAIYRDGTWDYLICRYSPPGNRDGSVVP